MFVGCSSPDLPIYWHYNDQRINRHNSSASNTGIFESQWFRRQFRDITSLMIFVSTFLDCFNSDTHYEDLGEINPELADLNDFIGRFEKLLHLQIAIKDDIVYKYRIRSKTLQTLHIQGENCGCHDLVCENLIEFSASILLSILMNSLFPSKLKYLSCRSLCNERKPVCFPHLEVLLLEYQRECIQLEYFPRLEKLHFNVIEGWDFLGVIKARDRIWSLCPSRRPLKIFLSGVEFSFERDDFDDEQSYCKTVRNLHDQLMALERRNNYTQTFFNHLVHRLRSLWHRNYLQLFPRSTLDVELLRFYVRCKENFESNRFGRTVLYCDSFGQTLEALRKDDLNMYRSLAKCVNYIFFLVPITNKESLLNVNDFFEWVSFAYLQEFDQDLLDILPNVFPDLRSFCVHPAHKKIDEPINCNFISKLNCLEGYYMCAKNCPIDLKEILRNCKYFSGATFGEFHFSKLYVVRGLTEDGWSLEKLDPDSFGQPKNRSKKQFLATDTFLNYCESLPQFNGKHEQTVASSTYLNKLFGMFSKAIQLM